MSPIQGALAGPYELSGYYIIPLINVSSTRHQSAFGLLNIYCVQSDHCEIKVKVATNIPIDNV